MSSTTVATSQSSLDSQQNFGKALAKEVLPSACFITATFSIFLLLLALLDIFFLSSEGRITVALAALTSSIIVLCLYLLLKFKLLPLIYLQAVMALVIGIGLANSLFHMWILKDITQSASVLLVVMTLGGLLLSTPWILILITLSWLGWGAVVVFMANDVNNLLHFGFTLFFASIIATITHYLHNNLSRSLVDLQANLNKQSTYLETMMKDITQSQERFRRLANASFEGIVIHDQNKILDTNDSFGKLFDVEVAKTIGISFLDFFDSKSVQIVQEKLQEGRNEVFEVFAKKSNGTIFPIEVITYDLPYEGGVIHIASVKDITIRKESEAKLIAYQQKLEQQNTELARANKLKNAFLANMSHELRTPLTAITGYAEVLLNQDFGPLNEDQKQYANDVYDAGIQLMELINRIFDLSKLDADKVTLHMQNINVDSLIQSALVIIRAQADAKGITLESSNHANNLLFVDPVRIKQVFYNYLSNAVKFTPQGGVVKIIAEDADDGVQVEVVDTGIGIAQEDIPQLFQPFSQLDNAINRVYEGAGLGLSLSKRLVELHGGKVWVESKKGQGSTFAFWLPKTLKTPPN